MNYIKLLTLLTLAMITGASYATGTTPADNVLLVATINGQSAFRPCVWKEGDDVIARQHSAFLYMTPGNHTVTVTCDGYNTSRPRTFTASTDSVNTIIIAMD